MAGDQPQICMDPKQVSFMWSYPNYIPLNAPTIRHVLECLDPLEFDRIYGAFFVRGKGIVPSRGKDVVRRSAEQAGRDPAKVELILGCPGALPNSGCDPRAAVEERIARGAGRLALPVTAFLPDLETTLARFGEEIIRPYARA